MRKISDRGEKKDLEKTGVCIVFLRMRHSLIEELDETIERVC